MEGACEGHLDLGALLGEHLLEERVVREEQVRALLGRSLGRQLLGGDARVQSLSVDELGGARPLEGVGLAVVLEEVAVRAELHRLVAGVHFVGREGPSDARACEVVGRVADLVGTAYLREPESLVVGASC